MSTFKRPIFLGDFHADVTFIYPPGSFTAEWTPHQPKGDELTDELISSYRAQRDAFISEITSALNISATVVDME